MEIYSDLSLKKKKAHPALQIEDVFLRSVSDEYPLWFPASFKCDFLYLEPLRQMGSAHFVKSIEAQKT